MSKNILPRNKNLNPRFLLVSGIHRWMHYFGVFFFACWLLSTMIEHSSMGLDFTRAARDFVPVTLVLAIFFTTFGICYGLAVCIADSRDQGELEDERLADLSGRTRFERGKKKYKWIYSENAKRSLPRPSCILPPRRPR